MDILFIVKFTVAGIYDLNVFFFVLGKSVLNVFSNIESLKLKISLINIPLKLKVLSVSNMTEDLFQLINPRSDIENNILLF